jgi:hypothetical protein
MDVVIMPYLRSATSTNWHSAVTHQWPIPSLFDFDIMNYTRVILQQGGGKTECLTATAEYLPSPATQCMAMQLAGF